jgi:Zn-dependent membrane protease YugP
MQLLLSASVQAGVSNLEVTTDDGDDDNDYYDDRRHQVHHSEQMYSRCIVNSITIK